MNNKLNHFLHRLTGRESRIPLIPVIALVIFIPVDIVLIAKFVGLL